MDYEVPYRESMMLDEGKVREVRRMNLSRVAFVAATTVLLTVGLGVGLGVGLRENPTSPNSCFSEFQKVENRHHVEEVKINACPSPLTLQCPQGKSNPPLIIVSLDGFRAEYLLRNMTPNLEKMSQCGVHTPFMRAMFPTKTFPNHLTIVTGLYPESHGIIDNFFYDLENNRTFSLSSEEVLNKRWYKGEPIWNTAKKAGKKVVSMLWAGSQVDIQDMRPDACYIYNKSLGYRGRVEEILTYFDDVDASNHPDLALLYFEQPDSAGHEQGPYGDSVQGNLTLVDNAIGLLVNGIMERGYKDCINFVVVADHGMDRSECRKTVNISEHLDIKKHHVYDGFHTRISGKYFLDIKNWKFLPKPDPVPIDETLSSLTCTNYNNTKDWYVRTHKKTDLPKRYHFSNNPNIDDVVLDIQPGYVVKAFRDNKCKMIMGGHGSDNTYSSMHAIFVGMGSSLKQELVEPFENIELYNLFADLVGIKPAPNNGTYGRLHFIIKGNDDELTEIDPNSINYSTCPLPQFLPERIEIRNIARFPTLNSSCFDGSSEDGLDNRLELTAPEITESLLFHLPLEYPGSIDAASSCKLIQRDFVSAFDPKLHMPIWTSFSLRHNKSAESNVLTKDWLSDKHKMESCVRADIRIKKMIDYSKFENKHLKIKRAFLFPPGFSKNKRDISDSHTSSNIVPMYEGFESGVWKEMMHLIEEYAEKYQRINVLIGPIFDQNADGLADSLDDMTQFVDESKQVPIPSHYYVSIMNCDEKRCVDSLRYLSFILPHTNSPGNCWDQRVDNYLRENVARMRDIELLTSLNLLTGMRSKEIKTRQLTFLSEEIWPRLSWLDVESQSCPKFEDDSQKCKGKKYPLLLISLDAFKPDYLNRNITPTISRLHKCGATHSSMMSVYPSVSAPNHFSIITGLYPESHGIIDNKMFDVSLNESFYQEEPSALNSHWWHAQPLWSKVRESNKTAMALYWPGSNVEILGGRPTEYEPHNENAPPQFRVNKVLDWLKRDELPDLINIYLSVVDDEGHNGGPDSVQLQESLEIADKFMQDLMDGIFKLNLLQCINVIVVSDHGMVRISDEKLIKFKDLLPEDVLEKIFIYEGAAPRISTRYSADQSSTKILVKEDERVSDKELLNNLTCKNPNMAPYLKLDFPKRFHYSNNDRIDEVLILLNEAWMATKNHHLSLKGHHGWDPMYESMKALFIGWGPCFKESAHFEESFQNIELYNLMTHLLDVPPRPNNGTWGSLHHLLSNPPTFSHPPPSLNHPIHAEINITCPFPRSDDELIAAANSSLYGCSIHKYDYQRLNKTLEKQIELERKHISHGKPSSQNISDVCLLHHEEFVSAYDKNLRLPIWSAFRLSSSPKLVDWTMPESIPDVRISPLHQPRCDDVLKNISFVPLFHPSFSQSLDNADDASLLTNIVPMYDAFIQDVWSKVLDKLFQYFPSSDFILGPIFDQNGDGLSDLISSPKMIIPSHYFIIALPNTNGSQSFETAAYVLPHSIRGPNELCQSLDNYMSTHKSRIRDVELLTGLKFLTSAESWETVRKRTYI